MTKATAVYAVAKRWGGGWELHIRDANGEMGGVTQSRSLSSAERQVRDYLATMYDLDDFDVDVTIEVETTKALDAEIAEVRRLAAEAAHLQREASERARVVAAKVHRRGLSIADTAAVLQVSKTRAAQLLASR
ncbi:MAG TPA: hypothetical protein VIW24_11285 [Aldersonia sp.]